MLATAKFLGIEPEATNIITCHLGNGCSMAAIRGGKVIDTTMGLTPLEGLMMGTRCGSIDPAAVIKLIELGNTPAEVDRIMNKKSGLYGVGGIDSGDMRDMLTAAEGGNERAALAIRMFVRRIVQYIGSYYVLVNKPAALVFTGGIGEFSVASASSRWRSAGASSTSSARSTSRSTRRRTRPASASPA